MGGASVEFVGDVGVSVVVWLLGCIFAAVGCLLEAFVSPLSNAIKLMSNESSFPQPVAF